MSAAQVSTETMKRTPLQNALEALCDQYSLVAVYAFGSRASEIVARVRGAAARIEYPASDVDIGVLPRRGHQLALVDKVGLTVRLEDLLGVGRVDLVALPDADPFLAANIVRGERLYVDNEYETDEYDLYVLRRAGDLAYLERERMAIILGETP